MKKKFNQQKGEIKSRKKTIKKSQLELLTINQLSICVKG